MTRLYVAGPMTGYPEWNFPAFERATADLRGAGYEVVSPHEIDLEGGFDPSSDGSGFDLRAALERDVEEVLNADGLALLDGWEESPGATVEVLAASSQGSPARKVAEWLTAAVAALALILGIGGAAPASSEAGGKREQRIMALAAKEDRLETRLDSAREKATVLKDRAPVVSRSAEREAVVLTKRLRKIRDRERALLTR